MTNPDCRHPGRWIVSAATGLAVVVLGPSLSACFSKGASRLLPRVRVRLL